ncbi:MAG: DUF5602 domain-containing protein [Gemmatimonadota bacterium]
MACTVLAAIGVWAVGCSSDSTGSNAQLATTYGAAVALGSGSARAYQVTENGTPTEVGVALSEAALDGLPSAPQMGGYEYVLQLPTGNMTQYQTVGLNWNPTGHPPSTVYTLPHFDVHFYMIASAERGAIDPSDPAFAAKAAALPAAGYQASGYVADPPANVIPHMGLHWTDSNAGEFHNQPFTRTFIYGSWDGRFVFLEPMITRAYLLTHPDEVVPLGSPVQHAINGYYPAGYRVSWNAAAAEYRIALANLSK